MEAAERNRALLDTTESPPQPPTAALHSPHDSAQRSSRPLLAMKAEPNLDRGQRHRLDDEATSLSTATPPAARLAVPVTQAPRPAWTTISGEAAPNLTDVPNSAYAARASPSGETAASPDIDVTSTTSGGTSWSLRVPWFKRRSEGSRYDVDVAGDVGSALSFGGSDSSYYREMMKEYDFMNMGEIVGHHDSDKQSPDISPPTGRKKLNRGDSERTMSLSSQVTLSRSSVSMSGDSISSFKEAEWTPPDSSYGAACPICGWVPKKTRRAVEFTIIGILIITLVFLVVTTSIRITNDHMAHGGTSENDVDLDDDFYVEVNPYADDDIYRADVDSDEEDAVDGGEDAQGDDDGGRMLRQNMLRKARKRRGLRVALWFD